MVFVKPGLSNYDHISETKECHSVSFVPLYVKTKQYGKVLVSAITCPTRLWYGEDAKEGSQRNRHVQLRASSRHLSTGVLPILLFCWRPGRHCVKLLSTEEYGF